MERHCTVFVEAMDAAPLAVAWAVRACDPTDLVELVAPYLLRQSEFDAETGRVVDAPTAARLRLLRAMDRVRAAAPDARLHLSPTPGSPADLLGPVSARSDLVVLAGRRRRFGPPRSRALLRQAQCPVVVVSAGPAGAPEALLAGPQGLRMEAAFDEVRHLTRP